MTFRFKFARKQLQLAILTLIVLNGGLSNAMPLQSSNFGIGLDGQPIRQLAKPGAGIVVLVFAATDCPISNRYIPEVARLANSLAAAGVDFWWVFSNPGDTLSVVRKHGKDYSISTPTLIDSRQELVRMAHVSVTPEAAIFVVKEGRLEEVYRGRIDDRYIAFGQERPQATHHELEAAIRAVLAGRPVPRPVAAPIGCSIVPDVLKP